VLSFRSNSLNSIKLFLLLYNFLFRNSESVSLFNSGKNFLHPIKFNTHLSQTRKCRNTLILSFWNFWNINLYFEKYFMEIYSEKFFPKYNFFQKNAFQNISWIFPEYFLKLIFVWRIFLKYFRNIFWNLILSEEYFWNFQIVMGWRWEVMGCRKLLPFDTLC